MDPLAARPPQVPGTQHQAPDLRNFVKQLVTGQLKATGQKAQQRHAAELHAAFQAAPAAVQRQAFDDVFGALQRFLVPQGFAQGLAKDFVHHHAGQRLASYDQQIQTTTDPWQRGQVSTQRHMLARYVGAGAAPVLLPMPQPQAWDAQGVAAPPARMPEPHFAAPRPQAQLLPGAFVPTRGGPLPPGAAPMPRQTGSARRPPEPSEPPAQGAPLRFPEPQDFLVGAPPPALASPATLQPPRPEALPASEIAARVDALVEGGPRLAAPALRDLLAQLQRDDLPTAKHARAYLRLERASRQEKFDKRTAAAVDQFLRDGATAQLERLQALVQARDNGEDIGTIDLVQAITGLLRNGRLPGAAASEAADLWQELAQSDTPRANVPTTSPAKPNAELRHIARAVALQEVNKRKTGAVLAPRLNFAEVRVSAMTGVDGALLAHVASTAGRGTFAKFKPVVLADGRVMAARMMRTNAKYIGNNGETNTTETPAHLYLAERQALHAAGSRFAPTQTLVDAKGRLYDIVELTEGDAGALTKQLTLTQRARVIPVALQDLLRDLDRLEAQQLAHRDIKPANVMWLRDGTFGLGDYGLAHQGPVLGHRGTPKFLAPELLDGTADGRGKVDAYALGLTMVEMLLGSEGMRTFPLQLHVSTGLDGRAQAANMRQVHAEWMQARRSVPARAMGPQAQALDLAYQQMVEVEPSVANLVFVQMLNPQPAARPSAKEALRQLTSQVPTSVLARRPVAADLRAVSDATPYNQRVRESVALLQAEHQKAIG